MISTAWPNKSSLCGYDLRQAGPAELPIVQAVHQLLSPPPASATPPFRLYGAADGGLRLEGELDFRWAGTVESLLTATAGDLRLPLLDLSGLEFADVAGMRAIATGARQLSRTLDHVELRGASATFQKVWRLLRFDRLSDLVLPT